MMFDDKDMLNFIELGISHFSCAGIHCTDCSLSFGDRCILTEAISANYERGNGLRHTDEKVIEKRRAVVVDW